MYFLHIIHGMPLTTIIKMIKMIVVKELMMRKKSCFLFVCFQKMLFPLYISKVINK